MIKRFYMGLLLVLGISCLLSGCGRDSSEQTEVNSHSEEEQDSRTGEETTMEEENERGSRDENAVRITLTSEITELETGLSTVRYEGDYGFDTFLEQGALPLTRMLQHLSHRCWHRKFIWKEFPLDAVPCQRKTRTADICSEEILTGMPAVG